MRLFQTSLYMLIFTMIISFIFAISVRADSVIPNAPMQPDFFSTRSRLATLEFESVAQIESTRQPDQNTAQQQAEEQITYLFGALSSNSKKGVPKREHTIQVKKIKEIQKNLFAIEFKYVGIIQIEGTSSTIQLPLPLNPDLIHEQASKTKACLDEDHPESEYYWYFFNPKKYGCGLKLDIDYAYVKGALKYKNNTDKTYPEYERLVDNKQITINMIFGMDDNAKSWNPMDSRDYNASNYRSFRQTHLDQGFKSKVFSDKEIADLIGESYDTPYIEELTKSTKQGTVKIQMYFGGIGFEDILFHRYLAASLKTASVIVYNGHSGLGKYLNLELIQRSIGHTVEMPKDKYQIVFWNGCSSFPYYNQMYFDLKVTPEDPAGIKNMDAIANGLATLFSEIAPSASVVVDAIVKWAETEEKTSYQDIIKNADSDNLISVSGDEDNER